MGFTLRYTLKINMSMHCIRYLQEKLNHLSTRLWLNSPLKYRTGVTAPIGLFLICCYKYIYCIRRYINRYSVHCSTICHFTGDILLQITIKIETSFIRLSQHHTESKKTCQISRKIKKCSKNSKTNPATKNKLKPSK